MFIILEGPRGVGKSTVAKKLFEKFSYDISHNVITCPSIEIIKETRTDSPIIDMENIINKKGQHTNSICIIDRFHLTELVMRSLDGYSTVRLSQLANNVWRIDQLLKAKTVCLPILLVAPQWIVMNRIKDRKDGRGDDGSSDPNVWIHLMHKASLDFNVIVNGNETRIDDIIDLIYDQCRYIFDAISSSPSLAMSKYIAPFPAHVFAIPEHFMVRSIIAPVSTKEKTK